MTEKRLVLDIPSDSVLGPLWSDESPASIRKHYGVSLDDLRRLLAAQGLHVISAADKAVLDAAARPRDDSRLDHSFAHWSQAVWQAEAARRGSEVKWSQPAQTALAMLAGGVFALFCLACLAPWIGLALRGCG